MGNIDLETTKTEAREEMDKIQETLDIIENFKEVYHCFITCTERVNVSAISRLIWLVIAWLNQILVMFGVYTIPTLSESENYILASVLTVIATTWSYWRNNSWSDHAKMGDAILALLRDTNIDTYHLLDAIKTVVEEAQTKNKEEMTKLVDAHSQPISPTSYDE